MSELIPAHIVVEDILSETVLRTMLNQSRRKYHVGNCYGRNGIGFIIKNLKSFNNAAKGTTFIILADLDRNECAPLLIRELSRHQLHHNCIVRIAVREIESWVLAHSTAFADYFKVPPSLIPANPDELPDPKEKLIDIIKRSRDKNFREAIVPAPGSIAKIGPDYNGVLSNFIQKKWKVASAVKNSDSLARAFRKFKTFVPEYRR